MRKYKRFRLHKTGASLFESWLGTMWGCSHTGLEHHVHLMGAV